MSTAIVSFFVLGAVCASFAGVIAARLHTGESFVRGRSRCDACGALLAPQALVPVLSVCFSRGRAFCCGARLSLFAPLSEIALGTLFALAYLRFGFSPALPFALLALFFLQALVLYDLAHQILPPLPLWLFVASAACAGFLALPSLAAFGAVVLGALVLALFLAALHFFSRGRLMGFADAPLTYGLALLAGASAFAGFLFSFWIGALIGIIMLAHRPYGSRMGVEVPFAPFLAAGFLLALFTQWNPVAFIAALGS